jgi:transcriptional regulator with XRE-family HTH domain
MTNEIDYIIGKRLRAKRNERGMSQTVVGEGLEPPFLCHAPEGVQGSRL